MTSRNTMIDRKGSGLRPGLTRLVVELASLALGDRVRLPMFGNLPDHVGRMRKLWFAELEAMDGPSLGRVPWRVLRTAPSMVMDAALLRLRYSIAHPGNGRTPVSNAIDETERMDGPGGAGRPRTLHRQILLRARKLCRLPSLFRAQHQAGSVRPRGRTGTG